MEAGKGEGSFISTVCVLHKAHTCAGFWVMRMLFVSVQPDYCLAGLETKNDADLSSLYLVLYRKGVPGTVLEQEDIPPFTYWYHVRGRKHVN
jgi:hypothetical protein